MRCADPRRIEYLQVVNIGIEGHVVNLQIAGVRYQREFKPSANSPEGREDASRAAHEYACRIREAAQKAGVEFIPL